MTTRPPTLIRYLGLGALGMALLASPALVSAPAQAMPVPGPGVECLAPAKAASAGARRGLDTPKVTQATLARVERETAVAARLARAAGPDAGLARTAAAPVYRVKVQIHLIRGAHRQDRMISRKAARKKIFRTLQAAYNGAQSSASTPMGIVFDLKRITVTRNDAWYHASPMSRADKQMKRKLHRGTASTLNIYVNKLRFPNSSQTLLGFARFPWQYAGHRKLDAVTINVRGLPIRGSMTGYNRGDTVVHETGHWLGLLHTFQGGCSDFNDGVPDTPAELNEYGNLYCADLDNLCDPEDVTVRGNYDPAYNFMEYTKDACMQMFTAGQLARVQRYAVYRFGR